MTARYVAAPGPDVDLEREDVRDSRGRRITQEYVDRAVVNAYRALRGRPSLGAPGQRSPQITFRLPSALQSRAEQAAADRGTTVSALAREALEAYLAS